jgi:Type VI secretion system VasI, EvfG, VC_A0118
MGRKKTIGIVVGAVVVLWVIGRLASGPTQNSSADPPQSAQATLPDKWHATESRSPMDDSKAVVLSLDSEAMIQGPLGPKKPTLFVRCKEGKTQVFVVTGMAASVEDEDEGHTVRLRFDQNPPQVGNWGESTSNSGLFYDGDGIAFAKQLAGASLLTFQFTPFDANPAVARFDLRGLDAHLGKVADACGWSLN